MNYTIIVLVSIAFLTGLATIKVVKPSFLLWLIVLLGITLLAEGLVNLAHNKIIFIGSVNLVYNIYSVINIIVLFYIYYNILQNTKLAKWVLPICIFVVGSSIIELCVVGNCQTICTVSLRIFSIVIILLSLCYLFISLALPYHNIFRDPYFYICAACILYHGLFFVNLTTMAEKNYWANAGTLKTFHILQDTASFLYYSLLCCTFLICYYNHRQRKRTISYRGLL